jgi:hypothetical protein
VIIRDFNVVSVAALPREAQAPLFIGADAVLAGTVALQRFQPAGRRYPQIRNLLCLIQHPQFVPRDVGKVVRETFGRLAQKYR